jgi:hypothetical protein
VQVAAVAGHVVASGAHLTITSDSRIVELPVAGSVLTERASGERPGRLALGVGVVKSDAAPADVKAFAPSTWIADCAPIVLARRPAQAKMSAEVTNVAENVAEPSTPQLPTDA